MQTCARRAILAAALAAIGGTALAQPHGPGMSGGPGMGRGPALGRMVDPSAYLDGLKAQLGITVAQTTAWDAYAEVVKSHAAQMQDLHRTMWESMPTASWQERRDMMNRTFEARQQSFAAVHDAALKLEPTLTAEQRTKAAGTLPGLLSASPMGPGRRWR